MSNYYNLILFILAISLFVSIVINIVLFLYSRKVFLRIYVASEEASEIFAILDAYREHLKSIYELPTFYGDDTLSGLLEHTKSVFEYLGKYEDVWSFTNPDLLEQLQEASIELEERYEEQEAQED